VIRRLGLAGQGDETADEVREARKAALEAGLAWLHVARRHDSPKAAHFYEDVTDQYTHRLASLDTDGGHEGPEKFSKIVEIQEGAAREERRVLMKMREEGRIGDEALRTVESELDLSEIRLEKVKPG
jgi:CPA1 family monovalent cation:H+ antiporter